MFLKLQLLLVIGLCSMAWFADGQSPHDFDLIKQVLDEIGE